MCSQLCTHRRIIYLLWVGVITSLPKLLCGQVAVSVGIGIGGTVKQPSSPPVRYPFDEFVSAASAQEGFFASIGSVAQLRGRLIYRLSPHVEVDLDMGYLAGLPSFRQIVENDEITFASQVKSVRVQLTPGVVLSLGERRFSPFIRLGAMLPSRNEITYQRTEVRNTGSVFQGLRLSAKALPGWTLALGMRYRLSKWIKLYASFEYVSQHVQLYKSELVTYEIDGQPALQDLETYQIQGVFKEVWREPLNQPLRATFDPDGPIQVQSPSQPLYVFNTNLGLIIVFR